MNLQASVTHHLGKHAGKRWKDIVCDISTVILGIKPSFLYDYSTCNPDSLFQLANDMIVNLGLRPSICVPLSDSLRNSPNQVLAVVLMGDDIILVNKYALVKALKLLLSRLSERDAASCIIVDVTGNLIGPMMADKVNIAHNVYAIAEILQQVESCLVTSGQFILSLKLQSDWNVSTIFGIFLGYPVLYWYRVEVDENCLALIPLCVHRCFCDFTFSCPTTDKDPDDSRSTMKKLRHVVYSFTVPEKFSSTVNDVVLEWKQNIQHLIRDCELHVLSPASFESEIMTLPAVAL